MRILMHCLYFPPEVGGLESHVYHLCRALVEKGHQVEMVTSRSLPEAAPREEMDGIRVWRTWFPARNPPGWILHTLGSIPRFLSRVGGVDVIHAQGFPSVVPGALGRRMSGSPLVATFHTSHFLRLARRRTWRPVLRRLVSSPDRSLATSREIAGVAETLAPGSRVEPVTNGVETKIFRRVEPGLPPPPEGRIRLIAPRRLFAKNGVEVLVRALPGILDQRDVEAVVIGDGPERDRLRSLSRTLGISNRIRFLGARPHRDMPGLLSSGDLAVIPSLMEATSVAALECMACELPVVASDVGGLPEIVDDEVGALVPPGDAAALAGAVDRLLGADDLKGKGRKARQRVVERWSNDRLAEHHLEIYRSLTAGRS